MILLIIYDIINRMVFLYVQETIQRSIIMNTAQDKITSSYNMQIWQGVTISFYRGLTFLPDVPIESGFSHLYDYLCYLFALFCPCYLSLSQGYIYCFMWLELWRIFILLFFYLFFIRKELKGRVLASCFLIKAVVSHDDLFIYHGEEQLRNEQTFQN